MSQPYVNSALMLTGSDDPVCCTTALCVVLNQPCHYNHASSWRNNRKRVLRVQHIIGHYLEFNLHYFTWVPKYTLQQTTWICMHPTTRSAKL